MMNLILVKREGLRRQAGEGAVYPERRGRSEAGGAGGGRRGGLIFRTTRKRLSAGEDIAREDAELCLPRCPPSLRVSLRPPLCPHSPESVSKALAVAWPGLSLPAYLCP